MELFISFLFLPAIQVTGTPSSEIVTLIYIASFVVLTLVSLLFASRIQASMMLGDIGRNLVKFKGYKNNSRQELLSYLTIICIVPLSDVEREVDRIIEYFTIMPENMDPDGVVGKMEQVVRLQVRRNDQSL